MTNCPTGREGGLLTVQAAAADRRHMLAQELYRTRPPWKSATVVDLERLLARKLPLRQMSLFVDDLEQTIPIQEVPGVF